MKLEKYVDKDKKRRKVILISISAIVLISVSLFLYKTFASFTESAEFPMMKGKVDYFGNSDVYFVFYVNDELVDEMPQKGNEDGLLYEHGECDNGASIVFDYVEWAPLVKNLSSRKTKCSLYFSEKGPGEYYANKVVECSKNNNGANCLMENANYDTLNLAYDKTSDNNLRYIGNNPNNYVKFNDEVWRIVGVMNNIEDENGVSESRIKLVNPTSIGSYAWDNKLKGEGSAKDYRGSNNWNDSTLQDVLNNGAYWNRINGMCPIDNYERRDIHAWVDCDFSNNGLKDETKNYIESVVWNISIINTDTTSLMKDFYDLERGNESYNADYPAKWTGLVGLLYPSDYMFAVGVDWHINCINIDKTNWATEEYSYCKDNNWLYFNNYDGYWTITPEIKDGGHGEQVFRIISTGGIGWKDVFRYKNEVLPSVYLKSNVKITEGNGSIDNPYELANESK